MLNQKITWFLSLTLAVAPIFAQENAPPPPQPPAEGQVPPPQQSSGGWRRFGDPAPGQNTNQGQYDNGQYNQGPGPYNGQYQGAPPPAAVQVPPTLIVPAGTWITVRLNQALSSDHNQPGDAFTTTLVQPVVVNGLVVARKGQSIQGRVEEVQKAGHVSGVSHLKVQLIEMVAVDGQQFPLKSTLIDRKGPTSVGQDVGTIGVTTGAGAAIGAAAAGGWGAGLGAIAGLGASTIGVLVTRGKPTVLYPETVLTFRLEAPITINTERSAYAFQPVSREDYQASGPSLRQGGQPGQPVYRPYPAYGAYPYAYPYGYPYGYVGAYPYWGPSFFIYGGPRYYYRGFRR